MNERESLFPPLTCGFHGGIWLSFCLKRNYCCPAKLLEGCLEGIISVTGGEALGQWSAQDICLEGSTLLACGWQRSLRVPCTAFQADATHSRVSEGFAPGYRDTAFQAVARDGGLTIQ